MHERGAWISHLHHSCGRLLKATILNFVGAFNAVSGVPAVRGAPKPRGPNGGAPQDQGMPFRVYGVGCKIRLSEVHQKHEALTSEVSETEVCLVECMVWGRYTGGACIFLGCATWSSVRPRPAVYHALTHRHPRTFHLVRFC